MQINECIGRRVWVKTGFIAAPKRLPPGGEVKTVSGLAVMSFHVGKTRLARSRGNVSRGGQSDASGPLTRHLDVTQGYATAWGWELITPPVRPLCSLTGAQRIAQTRSTQQSIMSLKRKAAAAATDASKKPKQNGSITAFFSAPKPDPNAPPKQIAAAAKFDRDAWVAKLTDDQKELLKLEIDTLHESWLPHLKDVLVTPQFLELKRFLKKELDSGKAVYPPMKDVYSW